MKWACSRNNVLFFLFGLSPHSSGNISDFWSENVIHNANSGAPKWIMSKNTSAVTYRFQGNLLHLHSVSGALWMLCLWNSQRYRSQTMHFLNLFFFSITEIKHIHWTSIYWMQQVSRREFIQTSSETRQTGYFISLSVWNTAEVLSSLVW